MANEDKWKRIAPPGRVKLTFWEACCLEEITVESLGFRPNSIRYSHQKCSPEIGEHFNRFEKMIQETIATTVRKTYASATPTPTPAPDTNRLSEIQRQNRERKEQERHERAKFEVTLTTQESDTKEQLAQLSHATNRRKSGEGKLPHNLRHPKA
jgi:transcriptional regulator of acetoin/glycerol metabolism